MGKRLIRKILEEHPVSGQLQRDTEVTQEALRNVEKHAGQCSIGVEVGFGSEDMTLSVTDNGQGFELPEAGQLAQSGKLGLLGMQERAQLLGAEFSIQSRPGQGTSMRVRLPAKG